MPLPMNQKPKGPRNWGKFSKTLSFWVLITLLAGTLFTYTSGSRTEAPRIDYTQYREQLDANNINAVKIQGGNTMIGEFRNKVAINIAGP
jgi:cell division protease FtsH